VLGTGGSDRSCDGAELVSWKAGSPVETIGPDPAEKDTGPLMTISNNWMANGMKPAETSFKTRRSAWASAPTEPLYDYDDLAIKRY